MSQLILLLNESMKRVINKTVIILLSKISSYAVYYCNLFEEISLNLHFIPILFNTNNYFVNSYSLYILVNQTYNSFNF